MTTRSIDQLLADTKKTLEWFDAETEQGVYPPYPIEIYELLVDLSAALEVEKVRISYEVGSINAVFNKLLGNPDLTHLTTKGANK